MTRVLLVAVALAAMALSGCSDDGDAPAALTEQDCFEQGLVLEDRNGTLECVVPPPPASIAIEGLPATAAAYDALVFGWVLDSPLEAPHAMRTEVRWGDPVTDDELAEPDDWGREVVTFAHQDFEPGARYDASFRPDAAGTYHFRAYALVSGEHIWSPGVTVEVGPVQPTGTVHDIHVDPGAQVQGPDPKQLEMALGDAVRFVNDDVKEHVFSISGPIETTVTAPMMGSSEPFVVLEPGSYTYTTGDAAGAIAGGFTVRLAE